MQDQVLRRVLVGERHGLIQRLGLDDQTLLDGLLDDVNSGQGSCLAIDFDLDFLQERLVEINGDQDDLRIDAVLGLGQQVGSNKDGVGGLVGDDL